MNGESNQLFSDVQTVIIFGIVIAIAITGILKFTHLNLMKPVDAFIVLSLSYLLSTIFLLGINQFFKLVYREYQKFS